MAFYYQMSDGNNNKQGPVELEAVFAAGDAWLRKYGMVTPIAHNAIVTNLYVAFPKVRYVEYFLSTNADARKILVVLHFPTLKLLFCRRERLINEVVEFLREYLHEYEITVELRRYKKGVEKSNEIPDAALKLNDVVPVCDGGIESTGISKAKSGDLFGDQDPDPKPES